MITIGELMNVDPGRQFRAQMCSVSLQKVYHEIRKETLLEKIKSFFLGNSSIRAYYVIIKTSVVSDSGSKHTVLIRISPDFNTNYSRLMNNTVQLYCDCSDFKYRSAYILNSRKGLFLNDRIKINLGAALTDKPKTKTQTTYLCKHAYAALQWLVSNYSNLIKTV